MNTGTLVSRLGRQKAEEREEEKRRQLEEERAAQ